MEIEDVDMQEGIVLHELWTGEMVVVNNCVFQSLVAGHGCVVYRWQET